MTAQHECTKYHRILCFKMVNFIMFYEIHLNKKTKESRVKPVCFRKQKHVSMPTRKITTE